MFRMTFVLILASQCANCLGADELQTWSDVSGKFSTRAALVRVADGKAVLRREDGTESSIQLEKLDRSSLLQVLQKTTTTSESRPETDKKGAASSDWATRKNGIPVREVVEAFHNANVSGTEIQKEKKAAEAIRSILDRLRGKSCSVRFEVKNVISRDSQLWAEGTFVDDIWNNGLSRSSTIPLTIKNAAQVNVGDIMLIDGTFAFTERWIGSSQNLSIGYLRVGDNRVAVGEGSRCFGLVKFTQRIDNESQGQRR